jgi:hypothetical protein
MGTESERMAMRIRSRKRHRQRDGILIATTVGLLLLLSSFSMPIISSVDHIEIYDLDGAQTTQIPSAIPASYVGENPYAWATVFETNRSVPIDHGKLELGCVVTNANLSSACIARLRGERLAFVDPIFTTSAYQANGFYAFYKLHAKDSTQHITSNLPLLNVSVVDGWGRASGLLGFIQTYEVKGYFPTDTPILTDINVNNGSLFSANGSRRFDIVVIGFSEYVTAREYQMYKHFVETGGTLVFLNACNFVAEVQYYPSVNKVALLSGHGWNFNSTMAWTGPFSRWSSNNSNWIGSDYALFYEQGYKIAGGSVAYNSNPIALAMQKAFGYNVFQNGYYGHEENVLTNSTDSVITYWDVDNWTNSSQVVASYSHIYQHGTVIHSGIFGTDIVANNYQMQFFLLLAMLSTTS